jgi:hypothetical protein
MREGGLPQGRCLIALSRASYLKDAIGAPTAIGERVVDGRRYLKIPLNAFTCD